MRDLGAGVVTDRTVVDDRVKDLYTRYPYPSAETETGVALFGLLDYVRWVLWPGRADLDDLRILDAGCGTGQVAVQIARAYPQVRVTGIDISAASLEVARRRAAAAGVPEGDRLSFRQASIEELSPGDQLFDYVISSGVLHHLADPVAGTRQLARMLAPAGGIGMMVYAPHGRHGVYVLQDALRRLVGDRDLAEQVVVARQLLAGLPDGHPFKPAQFADQDWADDAGLVDLLLHVRDRSFSVPELYQLLGQCDLRVERFFSPIAYRPENHTSDPDLKARVAALDEMDGAIMAELLSGCMPMHALFATPTGHRPLRAVPTEATLMSMRPVRSPLFRWDELWPGAHTHDGGTPKAKTQPKTQGGRRPPRSSTLRERNTSVLARSFEFDRWIVDILERCDGKRTTEEILADPAIQSAVPAVPAVPAGSVPEKAQRARQLIQFLAQQEILLVDI